MPRKHERSKASSAHHLVFAVTSYRPTLYVDVDNVSIEGIGLVASDFARVPEIGTKLPGHFKLGGKILKVELHVQHLTHGILGCKLVSQKPNFEKQFAEFFKKFFSAGS